MGITLIETRARQLAHTLGIDPTDAEHEATQAVTGMDAEPALLWTIAKRRVIDYAVRFRKLRCKLARVEWPADWQPMAPEAVESRAAEIVAELRREMPAEMATMELEPSPETYSARSRARKAILARYPNLCKIEWD